MSSNENSEAFPSLDVMRTTHRELLRQFRSGGGSEAFIGQVETFVASGRLTGTLLDNEDDRWAAQGILDYWSSMLYRQGIEEFDASLLDFDFALAPELPDELCPYVGLNVFDENTQERFFGRDRMVEQALSRLKSRPFLGILGPSGSGKTSLLLAGVIPALKDGALPTSNDWLYLPPMVPGDEPLLNLARITNLETPAGIPATMRSLRSDKRALQTVLDRLVEASDRKVVLIIDEFEDIFTRCRDADERLSFVNNLIYVVQEAGLQHMVLMTMHSDFERVVANYVAEMPELYQLFETSTLRITPPTASELREVIEGPAAEIGLRFEDELVNRLLQDVSGEHAALPLLQFTLLRLWERRERNVITWEAYHDVGGGREALVETASTFYHNLPTDERLIAKRIFLLLVQPTEGMGIELVPLSRDQLLASIGSTERVDEVMDKLVALHLVRHVISEDDADEAYYELVHDALAKDWLQLVEWLDEERFQHRQRLRLRSAAIQWQANDRSNDILLRGAFLEEAETYTGVSELEKEYLLASRNWLEREQEAERLRTEERIQMAERLADSERQRSQDSNRAYRRLASLAVIVGAMALVAVIASIIAFNQADLAQTKANEAEGSARLAQAAQSTAEAETQVRATSEAIAIDAQSDAEESAANAEESAANALAAQNELEIALAEVLESEATARQALAEAEQARIEAETAQAAAEESARLAKSGQLAAAAFSLQQQQIDLSLLLSLESINIADTIESRTVLLSGLESVVRQVTLEENERLLGHMERVFTVDVHPDGDVIASGGYDNAIIFWDVHSGQPIGEPLSAHSNWVRRVVFDPTGDILVSASYDNTFIMWDVSDLANPQLLSQTRGHDGPVNSAVYSPDGDLLYTASQDGTIAIWRVTDPLEPVRLSTPQGGHRGRVFDLGVTPDGDRLISVGEDTNVMIWDVRRPGFPRLEKTLTEHTTEVNAVAVSANGELLATGDDAGRINVWSLPSGEFLYSLLGHSNWILSLDFSPDGALLVSGSRDSSVILWDVDQRSLLAGPFLNHTDWVWDTKFSPNGRNLATAGRDQAVIWWTIRANEQLGQFIAQFGQSVQDIRVARPNELEIVSDDQLIGLQTSSVSVISPTIKSDVQFDDQTGIPLIGAKLHPQGTQMVSIISGTIAVWDTSTAQLTQELEGHSGPIYDLQFSSDGDLLASIGCAHLVDSTVPVDGDDRATSRAEQDVGEDVCMQSQLIVWDLNLYKPVGDPLLIPDSELVSVAFSPNGQLIALGGCVRNSPDAADNEGDELKDICSTGAVTIVDNTDLGYRLRGELSAIGSTSNEIAHGDFVEAVTFHPGGSTLATGSNDGHLVFWDVERGVRLSQPVQAHVGAVNEIEFSPDGVILATGGNDTNIFLWDVASRQRLAVQLASHGNPITTMSFSLDSRSLVSADSSGEIIRWRASLDSWRSLACEIANRNLTESEWNQYIGTRYMETCVPSQ